MIRSLPSLTCARIASRPAVDASVYGRKGRLKSGKVVMGLVVRSVLRRSKVSWQFVLNERPRSSGSKHVVVRRCCEVFDVAPVVLGETQKGVDFYGVLGRTDVPDGG